MSFKLEDFSFKKTKVKSKINFNLENNSKTAFIFNDKKEQKNFIKSLTGDLKITSGDVFIDDEKLYFLSNKKSEIAVISSQRFKIPLIPLKLRISFLFLRSPKFTRNAFLEYYDEKFEHKIIKKAYDNVQLFELYKVLDLLFKKCTGTFNEIVSVLLTEYNKKIKNLNKSWINKLLPDEGDNFKNKFFDYLNKEEEIIIYQHWIILLQAMWDIIYEQEKLRLSCNCEKENKKNDILNENFRYEELDIITKKFEKIISANINYFKYNIFVTKRKMKEQRTNIIKENGFFKTLKQIRYFTKNKNIKLAEVQVWLKLRRDLRKKLTDKQQELISSYLSVEGGILKGKIIEEVHNYHKKVLDEKIDYLDVNYIENKIKKTFLIDSPFKKANIKVFKIMQELKIQLKWFGSITKLSFFDNIKMHIINNFLLDKKIIILNNIFNTITRKETLELKEIIKMYQKLKPGVIFIFIDKNIFKVHDLATSFVFVDKKYVFLNNKPLEVNDHLTDDDQKYEKYNYFYCDFQQLKQTIFIDNKQFLTFKKMYGLPAEIILRINSELVSFKKTSMFNRNIINKLKIQLYRIMYQNNELIYSFYINGSFKINLNSKTAIKFSEMNKIFINKKAITIYDGKTRMIIYEE
ncbi:hypothetical protein [Spiroplasma endosymbiont of Amphibalanus improvisus]|uniref:hypothetical protein n=1 Tax=Spiroplasma endosymbiont of Amphibalanus improvisus TaxID=3066327 RepID=UPI00313DBAE8